MIKKIAVPVLLCLLLTGLPAQTAATPEGLTRAAQAPVRVLAGSLDPADGRFLRADSGSGVIIHSTGWVVTARHLVWNQDRNQAHPELWAGLVDGRYPHMPPNRAVRLKLVREDAAMDLALLKLTPKGGQQVRFPSFKIGASTNLQYGDTLTLLGFPVAQGPAMDRLAVNVLELDEARATLKVTGSLGKGASGGAVCGLDGALVGISLGEIQDQEVFWNDDDTPQNMLVLPRETGVVRTVEALRTLLAGLAPEVLAGGPAATTTLVTPAGGGALRVTGRVLDAASQKPVAGAMVGLLIAASQPEVYIGASDLVAWARTGADGTFQLGQRVRPGEYKMKVVHREYQTELATIKVTPETVDFLVTMDPEPR